MPRKASRDRGRDLRSVARWLAWRCGAKWQYVVEPGQKLDPDLAASVLEATSFFYIPGEHEDLIDRFIGASGPADEARIRDKLEILLGNGIIPDWQWSVLVEIASIMAPVFLAGRPWQIPKKISISIVREIDALASRCGVREACRIIGARLEIDSDVLRDRYRRAKTFWGEN
jgi:hypothetical protein